MYHIFIPGSIDRIPYNNGGIIITVSIDTVSMDGNGGCGGGRNNARNLPKVLVGKLSKLSP